MKKQLLLLCGISVLLSGFAKVNASENQEMRSALMQITKQPKGITKSADAKKNAIQSLVVKLKASRNCLRGTGCSKATSYLANYALGVVVGAIETGVMGAVASSQMKKALTGEGTVSERFEAAGKGFQVAGTINAVSILINELGYRALMKNKVSVFQCLTFKGCNDETKRYAFYRLGLASGTIGLFAALNMMNSLQSKEKIEL